METIQRQIRKVGEALEITQPGRTWVLEPGEPHHEWALAEVERLNASADRILYPRYNFWRDDRPEVTEDDERHFGNLYSEVAKSALEKMGWIVDKDVQDGAVVVEPAEEPGYWLVTLWKMAARLMLPHGRHYIRGRTERPTEWPAEAWEQLGRDLESKATVEAHYGSPN